MWFRPEQCCTPSAKHLRERFEDFGQIRPGVHLPAPNRPTLSPFRLLRSSSSSSSSLLPLPFREVERWTDVPPRVHLRRDRKSASFSFGHLCVVFASLMTPLLLPLSKETPTKSISRNPKKRNPWVFRKDKKGWQWSSSLSSSKTKRTCRF